MKTKKSASEETLECCGISFCPDSAEIDQNLQEKPVSKGSICLKMSHSAKVRESVEPLEIQKVIQNRGVLSGSICLITTAAPSTAGFR